MARTSAIRVGGVCPDKPSVLQEFADEGKTKDGRSFYRGVEDPGVYLYYDADCDGKGTIGAGWVFGGSRPSTTRDSDLDEDGACVILGDTSSTAHEVPVGVGVAFKLQNCTTGAGWATVPLTITITCNPGTDVTDCGSTYNVSSTSGEACAASSTTVCANQTYGGCHVSPGEQIPADLCACHPTCKTCGYSNMPTAATNCITCADANHIVAISSDSDGTGVCIPPPPTAAPTAQAFSAKEVCSVERTYTGCLQKASRQGTADSCCMWELGEVRGMCVPAEADDTSCTLNTASSTASDAPDVNVCADVVGAEDCPGNSMKSSGLFKCLHLYPELGDRNRDFESAPRIKPNLYSSKTKCWYVSASKLLSLSANLRVTHH